VVLGDVTTDPVEVACTVGATAGAMGNFGATGAVGAAGAADCGGVGGAGTVNVGRGVEVGTTSLGAAAGGGLAGFVLTAGGAGTDVFVSRGGGGGTAVCGGVAAGACCLLMMAFNASPGLEICERSILVLISSASARPSREGRLDAGDELALRRRARTFSASWSSSELEWLFFSVTPISGSTSRIDLLLTSSSRARSLIRILLIRPFVLRTVPLSLHINLTVSALDSPQPLDWFERVSFIVFSLLVLAFPLARPRKEHAPPAIPMIQPARHLPLQDWLPPGRNLRPLRLRPLRPRSPHLQP
jgi:hypothetical protein